LREGSRGFCRRERDAQGHRGNPRPHGNPSHRKLSADYINRKLQMAEWVWTVSPTYSDLFKIVHSHIALRQSWNTDVAQAQLRCFHPIGRLSVMTPIASDFLKARRNAQCHNQTNGTAANRMRSINDQPRLVVDRGTTAQLASWIVVGKIVVEMPPSNRDCEVPVHGIHV
jgi:hypothetical protein